MLHFSWKWKILDTLKNEYSLKLCESKLSSSVVKIWWLMILFVSAPWYACTSMQLGYEEKCTNIDEEENSVITCTNLLEVSSQVTNVDQ